MRKPTQKNPKPDRLDMRILAAMAERGRQTVSELSKLVGLSQTPCAARLERLEADQLILGYHAEVDVERLANLSLYYVTIVLEPYDSETARRVEALMAQSPYIVTADRLFGSRDYLVRLYARSAQHYYEIIAPFTELHADCETWPVSRPIVRHRLDRLVAQLKREAE